MSETKTGLNPYDGKLNKHNLCHFFLNLFASRFEDQIVSDTQKPRVDAYAIDSDLFIALMNDEEQYSIWPAKKETPPGWKDVGFSGSKPEVSA